MGMLGSGGGDLVLGPGASGFCDFSPVASPEDGDPLARFDSSQAL